MKKNLTDKQVQAYRLVSGEFEGLSTDEAARRMSITPQAVNRLLDRARTVCPQLFPLLTKQEANVKALFAIGWTRAEIADQLQVGLSRVSQIIGVINDKQGTNLQLSPIKMLSYQPWMDNKIVRKF